MNERSEIERALNIWFDDGPTRMPDRVVTVVADRIGSTRQRRRWRLQRRLLDMNLFVESRSGRGRRGPDRRRGLQPAARHVARRWWTARPITVGLGHAIAFGACRMGRLDAGDYVMRALPTDAMAFVITAPEGWAGFGEFFMSGPSGSGSPERDRDLRQPQP